MLLLVEGIQCTGGRYRQGVSIYRYPGPSASSLLVLANWLEVLTQRRGPGDGWVWLSRYR